MKAQENYNYQFEWDAKYCYPESQVLINKLNIKDAESFHTIEREITSIALQELIEFPIKGSFDFEHLKLIHKAIFEDIFSWAGETRTVNISKGSSFCSWMYIENSANKVFSQLKKEKYLQNVGVPALCNKFAYYFSEINAIHPFREGNGRAQRIFIEYLANSLGYTLQFSLLSNEEMLEASIQSFNGNLIPLISMFEKILQTVEEN